MSHRLVRNKSKWRPVARNKRRRTPIPWLAEYLRYLNAKTTPKTISASMRVALVDRLMENSYPINERL